MATPTNLPSAFTDNTTLPAATLNNLRGAFRVLQLSTVQGNTIQTTTTSTYADVTSLSITITPQATTNKILLIAANNLLASGAAADAGIRFLRSGSAVFTSIQAVMLANSGSSVSSIYLDSPSSTSALTYKVQFNRAVGSGTVYSNVDSTLYSTLLVAEISA
jgi:hypothetical protein